MSRKDFKLIAATIKSLPAGERERCAAAFAVALVSTNPRFDCDKFLRACDVAHSPSTTHADVMAAYNKVISLALADN